jgi:hypothetical protein
MNRYAIVKDNEVMNVVIWDGETEYTPGGELVALADDEPVGPGWSRADDEWVAPADDAPEG